MPEKRLFPICTAYPNGDVIFYRPDGSVQIAYHDDGAFDKPERAIPKWLLPALLKKYSDELVLPGEEK